MCLHEMVRIWRALGFPQVKPDETLWDEDEVAAARSIKLFLDAGVPEDAVIEISRVLGEGMSRLASTITGASSRSTRTDNSALGACATWPGSAGGCDDGRGCGRPEGVDRRSLLPNNSSSNPRESRSSMNALNA